MMNMIKRGVLGLMLGLVAVSCSDDEKEAEPVSPLAGDWKLAASGGSLAVGPAAGDYSWWSISDNDVTTRACLYDDVYSLKEDGTFQNVLGSSTWLESWQGAQQEGCGTPIAPHDGSAEGTWAAGTSTLTITGAGSFMGLAKVHNTGENGAPANNTIVYNYVLSNDNNTLELTIKGWNGGVPEATWYFRFVRQ